jgi:hypothetical protein
VAEAKRIFERMGHVIRMDQTSGAQEKLQSKLGSITKLGKTQTEIAGRWRE